ncbi:DUF1660 family phage protein [Lactococcus lactis]
MIKRTQKTQEAFRAFGVSCKELSFNRSDLDESENVFGEE